MPVPSAPAPERLAEAARLLALHRGDAAQAFAAVSQQFQVLQGRSQVLLTLATLTLSAASTTTQNAHQPPVIMT